MKAPSAVLISLAPVIMFASAGCGMITTKTVALAAGKFVAKEVYKKAKEEKARDEASKQTETASSESRDRSSDAG